MGISKYFLWTKSYASRLDTFQNLYELCQFFLSDFLASKCLDTSILYTTCNILFSLDANLNKEEDFSDARYSRGFRFQVNWVLLRGNLCFIRLSE